MVLRVPANLQDIVEQSWNIENEWPMGATLYKLVEVHRQFMSLQVLDIDALKWFMAETECKGVLRDKLGLNVRVGSHHPPLGGPHIRGALNDILQMAQKHQGESAYIYKVHQAYENLHPFTDGNGRSGRAIWLWMHSYVPRITFLHSWYYLSLQFGGDR